MRKIALVGTCPSGKDAPFDDESWEIWGVGSRADYVTRATRWFELHHLDTEEPDFAIAWRHNMKVWFKDTDTEIWMFSPESGFGNVIEYPVHRISQKYGTYFLTSSFSWMMALAIEEGATEVALYGIDMEYGTEYREQRAGVRHFIELMRHADIKVYRLATAGIAYEPVPYPMIDKDPLIRKVKWRKNVNEGNLAVYKASLEADKREIFGARMAVTESGLSQKKKYNSKDRVAELKKRIDILEKNATKLQADVVNCTVLENEQNWLLDYLIP